MNTNAGTAQILPFRYPPKAGRLSDKQRILMLFATGQITQEERDSWLKEGGHA